MKAQRFLAVAAVVAALVLAFASLGQSSSRPTKTFMRQKLVFAQGLLEGVTLEKYDLILTNAALLRDMSMTNSFVLLGNPDFQNRRAAFQASVDELISAAKAQDLERANTAYQKVTGGCVECHRYFRLEQFRKHGAPEQK